MTSHNGGSPVGWNGGVKGGRGRGRASLGGKVFLNKKVTF